MSYILYGFFSIVVCYIIGICVACFTSRRKIESIEKLPNDEAVREALIKRHAKLTKKIMSLLFPLIILFAIYLITFVLGVVSWFFDNQFESIDVYKLSTIVIYSYTGLILLILIPFIMLMINIYNIENMMEKDKGLFFLQYGEHGRLRNWSTFTNEFRAKINWTEKFTLNAYESIVKANIINDNRETEIHIISPSANSAECEEILATTIASKYAPGVIMDASDMIDTPDNIEDIKARLDSIETITFNYQSKVNADDLNTSYPSDLLGHVDVIFDNKGALWHKLSGKYKMENATALLRTYANQLKVGGIVIIDSYPSKFLRVFNSQYKLQMGNKISWFAENSTATKLETVYKNSKEIQEMFDNKTIGKGLYAVTYLIKN